MLLIRFSLFAFKGSPSELPALVDFFQREATSLAATSYDRRQLYDVLMDISLATQAMHDADRMPPACIVPLDSYLIRIN